MLEQDLHELGQTAHVLYRPQAPLHIVTRANVSARIGPRHYTGVAHYITASRLLEATSVSLSVCLFPQLDCDQAPDHHLEKDPDPVSGPYRGLAPAEPDGRRESASFAPSVDDLILCRARRTFVDPYHVLRSEYILQAPAPRLMCRRLSAAQLMRETMIRKGSLHAVLLSPPALLELDFLISIYPTGSGFGYQHDTISGEFHTTFKSRWWFASYQLMHIDTAQSVC